MKKIYLSSPHMSDEGYELQYVKEAFDTNWISTVGNNITQFENDLADYIGVKSAIALNSGTSAIHLALMALNIRENDIVFCQDLTFVATCNPILYQKATPVFIDSDFETWNMCPEALEEAFHKYKNNLPKAVIVVHLYGLSADIDKILEICNRYNVPLIEDAAESLGTKYKGKHTGSFGKFGIFSFNGNKIITTSGGGLLVSNDIEAIEKTRFWATQSKDKANFYQHSEIGYSYMMSNILAGIGRGQLKVLEQRIAQKKHIFDLYKKHIPLNFMPINDWNEPNYWLTCICTNGVPPLSVPAISDRHRTNGVPPLSVPAISDRHSTNGVSPFISKIITTLQTNNIEARHIWKPMHLQPLYKDYDFIGANTSEQIFYNGFCLPSDTKMIDDDIINISETIKCIISL